MRLAQPWWLLLLLPVAGLGWLFWKRLQRPDGFRFPTLQDIHRVWMKEPWGWDETYFFILLLSFILLVIALARPQLGTTREELSGQGVDIILALDTSGSMRSIDFKPQNRLGAAKEVAQKFIEGRAHDRIGLVAFGGTPLTLCPLTLDRRAILDLLNQTEIDMTRVDGTAIGLAIATAADRLRTSQAKSKVIILLTDGRNNVGSIDPITAAKAAGALGIKIYAIGAGSPEGGIMPIQDPMFGLRYVRIPNEELDENTLLQVAAMSGGKYFRAKDSNGLRHIFSQIDTLEKSEYKVTEFTHYRDIYVPWLFLGILLISAAVVTDKVVLRRLP
jgi:Ca-activated chloride channel homolog